ncbi:MAG: MFS transporter [Proteobacteria bacterium]|nr:MFS transporter [Pseudomonadota bacterium]
MNAPAPGAIGQRAGLVIVVLAQCLGTSLWFSPAGAADGLMARWQLGPPDFAWLLASTQIGFIAGTFLLALTGAADRWRASRLFAASCLVGAIANAALVAPGVGYPMAWAVRLLVGLCLAGIYPLGMKLVVQWVGGRPALALAWLVAMLTLGTAMPHALRAFGVVWPWQAVLLGSSLLAVIGGALVAAAGDGRFKATPAPGLRLSAADLRALLASRELRASAGGYFGHMWELYAFWSVVPALCLSTLLAAAQRPALGTAGAAGTAWSAWSAWSAWWVPIVIGSGALGCLIGGYAARRRGSAVVAFAALAGSGLMCALYPLLPTDAWPARLALLVLWGVLVVADSPQFSALSSQAAPAGLLGLALVVQNGIGFFISVVSIVVLGYGLGPWGDKALWLLLPGPVIGLWAMRSLLSPASRARLH